MTLRKLISANFFALILSNSALQATNTFGADDEFDAALERGILLKTITVAQLNNILNQNRYPFTGKASQPASSALPTIDKAESRTSVAQLSKPIKDRRPQQEKTKAVKTQRAAQTPHKTVQIEQAPASSKWVVPSNNQSHKLIFKRDLHGNILYENVGVTAPWNDFNIDDIRNGGSFAQEMQELLNELEKEKGKANLEKDLEPIAYRAMRADTYQRSLIKVGTTLGGGDCGFFAYGRQTSRSVFINRMINALLFPDTLPRMGDQREILYSLVTNELMQKAFLDEDGRFLKAIGSKKTCEELFKDGPENARIKPYVLANFVYKVYAQELECLSFHMLKALALLDGVNLCIWTEDNSQREMQGPAALKTLKLEDTMVNFPRSDTKHIFFDGNGHFSTAIEGENHDELQKMNIKSLLSLGLKKLLERKGVGAQEYAEYTEFMKTLYQVLCS